VEGDLAGDFHEVALEDGDQVFDGHGSKNTAKLMPIAEEPF